MTDLLEDLDIFLIESFVLSNFFIGLLFLLFISTSCSEFFLQKTSFALYEFIFSNMLWIVFATILLAGSEFVFTLKSQWLGGEVVSALILIPASFFILLKFKIIIFSFLSFEFKYPNVILYLPIIALYLSLPLFLMYLIFMYAGDWSK